jgi:hypothetical protein
MGIAKVDDKRCEFQFESTLNLDDFLRDFASGRAVSVVPSRLLASHKHLKSLLWSRQ